jgi:hypothetical protein
MIKKTDDTMRGMLAGAAITMMAAAMWLLFFRDVPPSNKELISAAIGGLLIKLTDVFGYYFNSSAGSQRKDETIGTLAQTAQVAQSALAPLSTAPDVTLQPGQTAVVAAEPETPDANAAPSPTGSPAA